MKEPRTPPGDARPRDFDDTRALALDALAHLTDGVLILDREARVLYANTAARTMRLPSHPTCWASEHHVFRSDERTPLRHDELPFVMALDGGEETTDDLFFRIHGDAGLHVRVSARCLRDEASRVRAVACLLRDRTLSRARERRAIQAERQKRAMLDNTPDLVWLKDNAGRFLAANRPFLDAAGLRSEAEIVGLTDLDVWPRALAERYQADDESVIHSRKQARVEEPLLDAKGNDRWVETFKTPVLDDAGEVIGTTGIARDITSHKHLEAALRTSNDLLEEGIRQRTRELAAAQEHLLQRTRFALVGQVASGMAHQLRNPLAAILNAAYVLARHLPSDEHPNIQNALEIIHDEVRHANLIITGLLDYAHLPGPTRQPTSLREVVDKALSDERVPSSIRVERDVPELPPVDIDAEQIRVALANIFRNAVEAMPDGGELRVEAKVEGAHVLIAIVDTGPGISGQVEGHLLEPLHSTKPMGLGLGLVTARTLLEAHGGNIARADVPNGARFEVRLPLAQAAAAQPAR